LKKKPESHFSSIEVSLLLNKKIMHKTYLLAAALLLIFACTDEVKRVYSDEEIAVETERFNTALDSIFDYEVSLSPVRQSYLGIKDRNNEWDVSNDSVSLFYHELNKAQLEFVKNNFNTDALDHQGKLTYRLYVNNTEESIKNFEWRFHNYPVNQMFGTHTWIPNFLMTIHNISDKRDADAWLERLSKVDVKIDEVIESLEIRKEKGIVAPKFVYPYVISDCENLLKGHPFENTEVNNPLLEDFLKDISKLEGLTDEELNFYRVEAEKTLVDVFKPAYEKLIVYMTDLETKANYKDGVWKLPKGSEYYRVALKRTTTTDYTPEQIFEIGMSEVKRIHSEMEKIMKQVDFKGTLQDFFVYMQENDDFFYPNTDEGRQAYIDENIVLIDAMMERLDELFITKPKAALEVRRVEPFREKSAGTAFYQSPAPDGSRPGIYYANMYDMRMMPKYEMEALSYHEAIPGHHMQISIAQELQGLPKYRTIGSGYTAYSEGWGLYSEFIPKEMGFYQDPYSDFGRLSMELWRACRLVVDVGIHEKKWTREKGISFYQSNTSASEGECIKMVERHIVMPSQATAYKIGQLKILDLREKAKEVLGDKFDIRQFHEVVLTNGPLPLNILEELVMEWVQTELTK
jgi:uncharacterized protein (DUF885 family)